ncbi:hypothetical protein [Salinarimonas rosea]|uniref:hypothetical protein n=1 Tax=Salinarimonas rosea TaxID=552063 RepID=UPI00040E00D4|nr:hypothetical protein [Salinarimonas rosea]
MTTMLDLLKSASGLLALLAAVAGLVGGWFVMRTKADSNERRVSALEDRAARIEKEAADFRIEVARSYVPHDKLREVEERLARRMDAIDTAIREGHRALMELLSRRGA